MSALSWIASQLGDKGQGLLGPIAIGSGLLTGRDGIEKAAGDQVSDGWAGLTDILRGGLGVAGGAAATMTGAGMGGAAAASLGPLAGAAAGGLFVGDKILAPLMFGDMEDTGTTYEDIPEDEHFEARTGNRVVDGAIDAVSGAYDFLGGLF